MQTAAMGFFLVIVAFVVASFVAAAVMAAPQAGRRRALFGSVGVGVAWLVVSALPTLTGLIGPEGVLPPQVFRWRPLVTARRAPLRPPISFNVFTISSAERGLPFTVVGTPASNSISTVSSASGAS